MSKKKVLLVDDDINFTKIMASRFHSRDYIVEIAHDGNQAIEKARQGPDIILLDVMLPGMNGYDVCSQLRQDESTSQIPIIMLTGSDVPEEKIKSLYIGADDYLTKPFEAEELFARVEGLLRRSLFFEEQVEGKVQIIDEIKTIIDEELLIPHFQPIFSLSPRKLLGIEVLSRPPKNSFFKNPEVLFDSAFHLGMLHDLELVGQKKALNALQEVVKKVLIFFNASPYLIMDPKFKSISSLHEQYTSPDSIGFELTERTPIKDFDIFFDTLNYFKDSGYKISIDDVGSGYASLNSIVELKPHYIKLDINLIRNIENDSVRKSMINAIVSFSNDTGIVLIAEGIEEPSQLRTIIDLGVDAGQGYFLGRPTPDIETVRKFLI